jgi:hypothetical protein
MSSLSNDRIVSICHDPTAKIILSSPQRSNKVARITNDLAVKFGHSVTFKNCPAAPRLRHSDCPRAHRISQKEGIGYVVMDYVAGKTLDLDSAKEVAKELGKVLNHIH